MSSCLVTPVLFPLLILFSISPGIARAQNFLQLAAKAREGRPDGVPREYGRGDSSVPEYVRIAESARRTAQIVAAPKAPEIPEFMKIAASVGRDSAASWKKTEFPQRATGGNRWQDSSVISTPPPVHVNSNTAHGPDGTTFIDYTSNELTGAEINDYFDEDRIYFEDWDPTTPWPDDKIPGAVLLEKSFVRRSVSTSLSEARVKRSMENIEPMRLTLKSIHKTMVEGRRLTPKTGVVDSRNRYRPFRQ